ncbi:MAG: prepilin-type N-terminal cleavage/methylation domain-containing protein [bacterium]|nr:prepilin-type N-terminal cleavage/methylation domain-containing protein [bacterium]
MNRKFWINDRGVTLIEVLIVMLIIGILSGIGIPFFGKVMEQAKDKKMITDLRNLAVAIGIHKVDYDQIPNAVDAVELVVILKSTVAQGSPLADTDPWGNFFDYIGNVASNSYTLRCRGKDGEIGDQASEYNFNVNNDTVVIDGVFVASHQGVASIAR